MSAVPKSSGDFMSFFKTGLKVVGLRSGIAAEELKLQCQAKPNIHSTVHQNFFDHDMIRCLSLSASQHSDLIRSLQLVVSESERPLKFASLLQWVSNESYNLLTSSKSDPPFPDPNILQDRLLFAIPKKGAFMLCSPSR